MTRTEEFVRAVPGIAVVIPDDAGYDAARVPWNSLADQRPAAVALPADADEVVTLVRAAADAGLRIAPQATGHGAGAMPDLADVVLVRTEKMSELSIDGATARVGAGVRWLDVVEAAGTKGLAACMARPPTSAWSATRSAAGSAGTGAGWACRATA